MIRPTLALFYSQLMEARTQAYKKNIFSVEKALCPLISVGNITVGGTGKTPVVSHLISWLLSKKLKPGVVSRGYGRRYSGTIAVDLQATHLNNNTNFLGDAETALFGHKARVSLGERATALFGDEPTMLKQTHPYVPIYLSTKRIHACDQLVKKENVDLIIADDAFQHRSLHRDLDIVVINALEPLKNYRVLPWGRARESLSALQYADCIILNKVNLASKNFVNELCDTIRIYSQSPIVHAESVVKELKPLSHHHQIFHNTQNFSPDAPVHDSHDSHGAQEFSHNIQNFSRDSQGERKNLLPQTALLVSGIGHPESFEQLVIQQGIKIMGHLKYPDHHRFCASDMKKIFLHLKSLNTENIIITHKDAVKILEIYPTPPSMKKDSEKKNSNLECIWVLHLDMKFDPSWDFLREKMLRKLLTRSMND